MLSYMLPVEEKSPSAAAAAATRNLSLNLTTTTATTTAVGGGSVGGGVVVSTGGSAGGATATIARDCNTGASTISASTSASTGQVRSIIKPTVKHGTANHRYQLIGSGGTDAKLLGPGEGRQTRHGSGHWQDEQEVEPDLCDESTNLLAGTGCGEDDDDVDEREVGIDDRPRRPGPVKSDKNFNNLIVVTNGRHTTKPTNGNHAASTPKLASALKPTNNCVSGPVGRPGSSSSNSGGGGGAAGNHTSSSGGAYYNGYIAVSGDNDDEHHRMLVSANNLRNTSVVEQRQEWNAAGRNGEGLVTSAATTTDPPRPASSSFSSTSRITTTTNGNCRTMNSLNGNLMGTEPPPAVAPLPLETAEMGSGAADVSLGSDSDSATGAGGSATTGGGKKVKLNKLGGNKNVTLKRVSFGSSKGSMVETLVFETPTPLPEHAEREFFQSPAVLAGAGHTTVYSGGSGPPGNLVHHHYPSTGLSGLHHVPHHHAPSHHHHHHLQYHPQYSGGGYHPLDGGTGTAGPHDDSGIELQEEVERSKVRVSFFQSSKPQSISPPESLHLYGGQSLIQFGNGGTGGGGGYDNNNSPLDTYITSAALNQQYDSLTNHQQQHAHFHPDHRDPNMAAVYGGTNVPPTAFNRQMSTESGWDNPFRPGGDLSREADEIVNLIKGGKPITPTGDQSLVNGSTPKDSHSTDDPDTTVVDGAVTKHEASQLQAAQQNGTKSPHKSPGTTGAAGTGSPALGTKNGTTTVADGSTVHSSTTPISNQVIPGPQSASHVVIDEKKKKKCTCCVIQ